MTEIGADAHERARRVMERCAVLSVHTEEPGRLTRRYGSPALLAAREQVAGWMAAAGLAVRRDAAGNLFGRRDGATAGAPTLLLGSHLDSVRDAGNYDGPLGVLTALACAEALAERAEPLPFAVEVVAFADEEGLRFHTMYLGSSAVAGSFDPAWLDWTDDDGVTLATAMREIGGDPAAIDSARWAGGPLLGWTEVHIEQGPVLEGLDLPVGVVTGIVAQTKIAIRFTGEAGHAGTLPMDRRRDAFCAAAEATLACEAHARTTDGLVATVGQVAVSPGAANVVPGMVHLSLDVRHPDNEVLAGACRTMRERSEAIASERGVAVSWETLHDHPAMPSDAGLSGALERAVVAAGLPVQRLPSGAGHDAAALAAIGPTAMLFVRCAGGISHNPAESVAEEDVAVAIEVLDRFVDDLMMTG